MTLDAGARLGPYEIVELIGRGGMGEVYRAQDPRLGREVAIKVLAQHLAGDAESLARFRREARAIAALSHPNIVAIFDVGSDGELQYVVTELLEGEMLRTRIDRGAIPLDETMRIGLAIAEGLAAAHAKGIIHRDLKPENVFLTMAGGVKILDFGLAVTPRVDGTATTLTTPGMVVGTIGYMSPEQLSGKPLTPATDVFAFGCLLYEMLLRDRPFTGESGIEVIASILRDDPFQRHGTVPEPLRGVIAECLEKNPEARLQNGEELRRALAAPHPAFGHPLPASRGEGPSNLSPRVSGERVREAGVRGSRVAIAIAALLAILIAGALADRSIRNRRRIIDDGYVLRASDVTGDGETKRLTELALRADAAGDRTTAIELLREAVRRDARSPLPAAFLSSFAYHEVDRAEGMRWAAETNRRLAGATSSYESLLARYLLPDASTATAQALATSLLELRPKAWRLRLSLAHRHLDRREMPAMLEQLKEIDVSALDDRRAAVVLADRASLGDAAGAAHDLAGSRLATHPALLAYTRGRIAWSTGHPADAVRFFDEAADTATTQNLIPVAMESRILGGVARVGAGDLAGAENAFDVAAFKAMQLRSTPIAVDAYGFGAYVAWRLGDAAGAERRMREAASAAQQGGIETAPLRLLALRMRLDVAFPPRGDDDPPVVTLIRAREAWARGDGAAAARLLAQSRAEGVDTTWFAEEAALLEKDLGDTPTRVFRADPPYPIRLRYIAIWELLLPRRA